MFMLLKDLISIPRNYELSKAHRRYFSSLTPRWEILRRIHKIEVEITLEPHAQFPVLPHENDVNTHLFKPKYVELHPGIFKCMVSSTEAATHTLRGLAFSAYELGLEHIEIEIIDRKNAPRKYIQQWKIGEKVIIGRVESILLFLNILWLLERGVSPKLVSQYVVCLELQRIGLYRDTELKNVIAKIASQCGRDPRDFESDFRVVHLVSRSPYFQGVNFKYNGTDITAVQLTWGYSLSYETAKTLLDISPSLSQVAIVGGVGYNGTSDVKVDDIFIPTAIVKCGKNEKHFREKLDNGVNQSFANQYFYKKQVFRGTICSVRPRWSPEDYNVDLTKSGLDNKITAYDMEFQGFIDSFSNRSSVRLGAIFYIMDISKKKLGLGNTYYYLNFLLKLFSNSNRGKFYCYEKALSFLSN